MYAGRDPLTGRERYLKKTVPDTAKQAEVALTALLSQVDEQRHPRSSLTVRHMIEKWFDVADHARSTRHAYVQLVHNYIEPAFGNMQVSKLDPELLEGFYARLMRCRALCGGKKRPGHTCRPLSNSSI